MTVSETMINDDVIEDLSGLPDDLWECILDNPASESVSPETVQSITKIEEKLLTLEEHGEQGDRLPTQELVDDVLNVDHAELDGILEKDMERLSLEERDKCVEDLYGVGSGARIPEDPAFVDDRLAQMEKCLSEICKKDAYDRAKYMSPEYVQDRKRRIGFLKAAEFDPEEAARAYVLHFDEKLSLFGTDSLVREITLNDLDDCEEELKAGTHQILPRRDRADRAVLICPPFPKDWDLTPSRIQKLCRIFYYVIMSAIQDEDTQKNGLVVVALSVGSCSGATSQVPFLVRAQKVARTFPVYLTGFHYVYDSRLMYPFVTFTRFLFGSYLRGRFMTHFGKKSEYTYSLQTYGIPTEDLPIDSDGNVLTYNHLEWLRRRRNQEASGVQAAAVIPRRFDVLMGRGRAISAHTGNLRCVHIVEMNLERYEKATKFEKTQIAERIVHLVHQSYARFLKKEEGEWIEASREEAREKIAHCFRRLRGAKSSGKSTKALKRTSRDDNSSADGPELAADGTKKSKP